MRERGGERGGTGQGDEQGLGLLRDHRSRFYSRMKGIIGEFELGSNLVWFRSSGNLSVAVVGRRHSEDDSVRETEDELGQPLGASDGLPEWGK